MAGRKKQTRSPAQRKAIAARMREYHSKRRAMKAETVRATRFLTEGATEMAPGVTAVSPLDVVEHQRERDHTARLQSIEIAKLSGRVDALVETIITLVKRGY